jgi:hypothetical protein
MHNLVAVVSTIGAVLESIEVGGTVVDREKKPAEGPWRKDLRWRCSPRSCVCR